MHGKEAEQNWLIFSIIGYFAMSASILLIPFSSYMRQWFIGCIFWISLIMAVTGQVVLAIDRKKWIARYRIKDKRFLSGGLGIFNFVKNVPAIIADSILLISIIVAIIAFIATSGTGYACYVAVALIMFSFSMHCIFNGKIYFYIVNRDLVVKSGKRLDFKKGVLKNEGKK